MTRDSAVSRAQPRNAAEGRRGDDRAGSFRADTERDQSGGHGRARPRRRAAAPIVLVPGRLARARPRRVRFVVTHPAREFYHRQLGDENRPGLAQLLNDRGVLVELLIFVRRRAPGRLCVARGEQVFRAVRNAVKRPAVTAATNLSLGGLRLVERGLPHQTRHGPEPASHRLKAREITFRQLDRGDAPRAYERREFRDGREENVVRKHRSSKKEKGKRQKGRPRRGHT